jgi:hypothetical protein
VFRELEQQQSKKVVDGKNAQVSSSRGDVCGGSKEFKTHPKNSIDAKRQGSIEMRTIKNENHNFEGCSGTQQKPWVVHDVCGNSHSWLSVCVSSVVQDVLSSYGIWWDYCRDDNGES